MIFAYNGVNKGKKRRFFDEAVIQAAVWIMLRGTLFGRDARRLRRGSFAARMRKPEGWPGVTIC